MSKQRAERRREARAKAKVFERRAGSIRTTTDRDGVPGLMTSTIPVGADRLLVSEWNTESGAIHHPINDTFTPALFINIKGRWNTTNMNADLDLIVVADAGSDIASGIEAAAKRAPIDADWAKKDQQ